MAKTPDRLFDDSPLHPGEHLRELLSQKQWTQDELATITGRSRQQINDICAGRRGVTAEMAVALGAAFGTSPTYWLSLESAYQLASVSEPKEAIMERARAFELAPIKEMQRRGWIPDTKDGPSLTKCIMEFFETDTLDDGAIGFPLATRKRAPLSALTISQRAWCFRARHLARALQVRPFDPSRVGKLKEKLRKLAAYRNEAAHVAEVFGDFGVRFVVIEPLPGSQIDGAAFWFDEQSPAIAVSLRFDRHDSFWHTVLHEFGHIVNGDALSVDDDLGGDDKPGGSERAPSLLKEESERLADEFAADTLVPRPDLESLIRRVGPLYSQTRIVQFAHSVKMHPGVVVGQLQHRGELGFHSHRKLLAKVRDLVVNTALTDGWGQSVDCDLN